MKDYGIIVADNGSGWYISGIPSTRWNNDDLQKLGMVKGSDFEALNLAPIVSGLSPTSGPTGGGTHVMVNGYAFMGGAGLTKVYFGNVQATQLTIENNGTLRVVSPPHAEGVVDIKVVSPYATSAVSHASKYTYYASLFIGSMSFAPNPSDTDGDEFPFLR
jgi:hypothetical protein